MPDLTPQPGSAVTVQAPTSGVSPGQIAAPYQQLANSLKLTGEAAEATAENLATQEGLKAVTKDAQGNIQIEQAPIIGPASHYYHAAVKMAALVEADGDAKRQDIALRQQFRNDPQGYDAAATAFRQKLQADYTAKAGADVGLAVGKTVEATTTQTYRGLLNEKERLDLQRADKTIEAGIASNRDDAIALSRGGDTTSDAFKAAVGNVEALTAERVKNPRLAYPQDKAAYDLEHFHGELKANGFLYHIDQVYQTAPSREEGAKTAMEAAKSILTDTSLKLTEQERNAYYHKAVGEIHANEALRKQDVAEARAASYELSLSAAAGMPVAPEDVEHVAEAFRRAGAPGDAARVYATYARKPLNDSFGLQPLGEQTRQLNELQGTARWQGAYQFFIDKGYSKEQAAGIVGGLRGETENLNPAAIHDGGIGLGISGWNGPRLAALRKFASDNNASPTDLRTQLEFLHQELQGNESAAGARLKAARTPEEAGAAMLTYFRPSNYDVPGAHPERAAYARQAFDAFNGGPPAPGGPTPASTLWLQANRTKTVAANAEATWKVMQNEWATKGIRPPDKALATVIDAAHAANDHALLESVAAGVTRMDISNDISARPLPEQEAVRTALTTAANTGMLSPGQKGVLDDLQRRSTAITTGLKENPIATAVQNFSDKLRQPPPLDFSSPKNLADGMKMRGDIARFAAGNWQTKPLSALDAPEVNQIKGIIEGPDAGAKATVFQALSVLPDDVRNATLAKLAEKGGPEMAVSVAAGAMLRTAPDVAQSIMRGQNALKTDKAYWPKGAGEEVKTTETLNKALPPAAFGLVASTDPHGAYATATGMVKARYADLSAQAGDVSGKLNEDRLRTSVTDVTGGVLSHNGAPLIAPQRGMSQIDFGRTLGGVTDADLAGVSTLNGAPVTADYLRGSAQLESIGSGRYLLRLGKDPARPVYAYQGANTEAPQKFVLDLRSRPLGPDPISTFSPAAFAMSLRHTP